MYHVRSKGDICRTIVSTTVLVVCTIIVVLFLVETTVQLGVWLYVHAVMKKKSLGILKVDLCIRVLKLDFW